MNTIGVICEYNPFHRGHHKQLQRIRALEGADCGIVCLMSGNFVQRGAPAIFDKSLRARAAVESGADLVLELPITAALSSAEGFASEGVRILGRFCDKLCFGAEQADADRLLAIANALISDDFSPALRCELDKGLSFPAARSAALGAMGLDGQILSTPNNILAVEYCKAILSQHTAISPLPIHREGSYHDRTPDAENPSATSLRRLIRENGDWMPYIPDAVAEIFDGAAIHSLDAGERAVLTRLRIMTDVEFEALPYGSEGLWRKLMHAARSKASLEEVAMDVKSKRYTRTRIDRMILCAFLGLTAADFAASAPYTRVLAFNDHGREIIKKAREHGDFPNIGEKFDHPYQQLEIRCDDLYALFATPAPEAPGQTSKRRVYYKK